MSIYNLNVLDKNHNNNLQEKDQQVSCFNITGKRNILQFVQTCKFYVSLF